MLGLTHQNFLSAATGIVLAVALIRGFARASTKTVGNFWVDLTRCTLYVLLPICIGYTIFLVWQGMPQTLGAYVDATTLEGAKQTIAVASRLPKVTVPVLSSSNVSTSPAASTARPDIDKTLNRTNRSMPAMPMAESNAPIVVGISVTNNATRMTTEIVPPA